MDGILKSLDTAHFFIIRNQNTDLAKNSKKLITRINSKGQVYG